jgi:hypothetical protein
MLPAYPRQSLHARSTSIEYLAYKASGSSTIRTSLVVPAGRSLHASSGDTSSPLQVWRFGITPPAVNAVEARESAMVRIS